MDGYETILARMKDEFTLLAGYSPDDASDIGIRMKVLAGEIYSLNSAVEWLKMQTFAQTAQGEQLDLRAQERGITRKPPAVATGTLKLQRGTPLWYSAVIPAGVVCATAGDDPVRYVTLEECVIPQGELSVTVPAKAESGGCAGNTQPGTVSVLITPPPGAESVTNPAAFTGGEDSESDSELRARVLQSYAGIDNGTNASFYREFALRYDGVHSVGVIPRESGAGTVGVYLGGRGAACPADVVEQVRSGLEKAREINVSVHVAPAQMVTMDLIITVTPADGYAAAEAASAAEQTIRDSFSRFAVGEPVFMAAVGASVLATGKVKNYVFNSTVTDRDTAANQLAVLGTCTVQTSTGGGA